MAKQRKRFTYYIPLQINPALLLQGTFPENSKQKFPYCPTKIMAQQLLKTMTPSKQPLGTVVFGKNQDQHVWYPTVQAIYRVEVSQKKTEVLALNAHQVQDIGIVYLGTVAGRRIRETEYMIGEDIFHPAKQLQSVIPEGSIATHSNLISELQLRSTYLWEFYRAIEHTNPRLRRTVDLDNVIAMDSIRDAYGPDGFIHTTHNNTMDRYAQAYLRYISVAASIDTVAKLKEIRCAFELYTEEQPKATDILKASRAMQATAHEYAQRAEENGNPQEQTIFAYIEQWAAEDELVATLHQNFATTGEIYGRF